MVLCTTHVAALTAASANSPRSSMEASLASTAPLMQVVALSLSCLTGLRSRENQVGIAPLGSCACIRKRP